MTIKANSKYTAFRIPVSHVDELDKLAKTLGLSVNALICLVIKGILGGTIDITKERD